MAAANSSRSRGINIETNLGAVCGGGRDGMGRHVAPFAIRVEGDSMEPTIADGAVVIVDPSRTPIDGSVVVVRQGGESVATIKRLLADGTQMYLKADNPRYPSMQIAPDAVIVGVAVAIEKDLPRVCVEGVQHG